MIKLPWCPVIKLDLVSSQGQATTAMSHAGSQAGSTVPVMTESSAIRILAQFLKFIWTLSRYLNFHVFSELNEISQTSAAQLSLLFVIV